MSQSSKSKRDTVKAPSKVDVIIKLSLINRNFFKKKKNSRKEHSSDIFNHFRLKKPFILKSTSKPRGSPPIMCTEGHVLKTLELNGTGWRRMHAFDRGNGGTGNFFVCFWLSNHLSSQSLLPHHLVQHPHPQPHPRLIPHCCPCY